jgi:hypothetical protein
MINLIIQQAKVFTICIKLVRKTGRHDLRMPGTDPDRYCRFQNQLTFYK